MAHSAGLKPFRIHETLMGRGEISPSTELLGNSVKPNRSCPAAVTSVKIRNTKNQTLSKGEGVLEAVHVQQPLERCEGS